MYELPIILIYARLIYVLWHDVARSSFYGISDSRLQLRRNVDANSLSERMARLYVRLYLMCIFQIRKTSS